MSRQGGSKKKEELRSAVEIIRSAGDEINDLAGVRSKVLALSSWGNLVTLVPEGLYCYDEDGKCPFWGKNIDKDNQESGYCVLIGQADWLPETCPEYECVQSSDTEDLGTCHSSGLLWDQVKECGLYEDWTVHDWKEPDDE